MPLFRHLLRFSRRAFVLAVLAAVVSGAAGAAFIAAVNQALAAARDGVAPAAVIWTYVVLCLVTVVMRFVSQSLLFRLSQAAVHQLRRRLVDAILAAPLRTVERTGAPRLFSALADDVVVIADALPGLPLLCSSVAFLVVCLGYLTVVSPALTGIALLSTVLGVAAYQAFSRSGMRSLRAARAEQDELFEHFHAVTDGIKELTLNRRRRAEIAGRQLDATAAAYRRHSVRGLTVFEAAGGSGQAVFLSLVGVILFVLPGRLGLDAATLSDVVLVLLFAVASLQGVLTWLPALGRASVALRAIEAHLSALAPPGPAPGPASTAASGRDLGRWRRIDLCGVSHVYPGPAGEEFVLGPLDLQIRRGEVLFVVGGNGSGKTTLAKLLTSLYEPQTGVIEVDGTPVGLADRASYRELFAAVFSDFFLFRSLAGLPAESLGEQARAHLTRLQLTHKVHLDGDRFSTTALSQGQRKRLALVTAYLEERSCYVFDEWAADQDPAFKEFFYTELLAELRAADKAVVVISHDDRYFHVADRILRLENGSIRSEEVFDAQPLARRTGA